MNMNRIAKVIEIVPKLHYRIGTKKKMGEALEKGGSWYQKLLSDLKHLAFEGIVKTKWLIGKRIIEDELKFGKPEYGSKRIENLAKDLDGNVRDLWCCIQFAKKCDNITQLENKTWMDITHNYLPEHRQEKPLVLPLPAGKYNIIYADPPWTFYAGGYKNQSQHYDTMSIQEICNLPIQELTDDNCILFLWGTFPILPDVFKVISAWGFAYSTIGFVWIKSKKDRTGFAFGLGNWTRANAELCLIATKGKIERKDASISQIIYEPLEKHSKKPDIVRDKIVQLVGDLPRIELFARGEGVKGWQKWGTND